MAKQKKNNHSIIQPVPREAIAAERGEEDFVELLRRELEWPIPMNVQGLADVTIPHDLQRQWIQGTGPAAKPNASLENSIRNVAYALLSGADGWMFDGEDALGQIRTMSLDNQRNLKLAIHKDPVFMRTACWTMSDTQTPPGSANASNRAAILTPSP